MVNYFGESAKTTPPSVFFPVFVRFLKAYKVRSAIFSHPWATRVKLPLPASVPEPLEENAPRFWLHLCHSTQAYSPRPQKQERAAGSDSRTAVLRLVRLFPLLLSPSSSSSIPRHPRPASPTHFLRLFSVWIYGTWDLRKHKVFGVNVCLSVYPRLEGRTAGHLEKWTSGEAECVRIWGRLPVHSHI